MEVQYRALEMPAPAYSWKSRMPGVHSGLFSCQDPKILLSHFWIILRLCANAKIKSIQTASWSSEKDVQKTYTVPQQRLTFISQKQLHETPVQTLADH